jgi:sirohydrochlorin cobaltochelatase
VLPVTNQQAVLVVSFGSSHHQTRQDTIEAIEQDIAAAHPGRIVRRAFTSGMIIRKLREEGIAVHGVAPALESLMAEGVNDLILQPTHVTAGFEYEKMRSQAQSYQGRFARVSLGAPLLSGEEDYVQVAAALAAAAKSYDRPDTAVVWLGHGSAHPANSVYPRLERHCRQAGGRRHFIGTVEAKPDLEAVAAAVKACGGIKKVVLLPLMIVAGEHAVQDMAGDQADSWKTAFERAGYEVECVLQGLGQYPAIRRIFVRHSLEAAPWEG